MKQSRKTILTVVGARPQFIKCAPVSKELRKYFNEILVHTGQHYDDEMSSVFFQQLNIPKPDYNLNAGSASHTKQTARIMLGLEKLVIKHKPHLVLIYGDTNSTLAGALVAVKMQIPIAHIEAGLRSFNKNMPEEHNRIAADHFSTFLFCPSDTAVKNLKKEGITNNVYSVGDVMKDAVLININKIHTKAISKKFELDLLKPYYFTTIHRQENTDDLKRFEQIVSILASAKHQVVFPMHPRTRKVIRTNKFILPPNVKCITPVNYLESLGLQKNAKLVLTDSGGIQKEAYFLHTPCITLRDETEWIETVKDRKNFIVGTNLKKFLKAEQIILHKGLAFSSSSYFGDGNAAEKIVRVLNDYL